MFQLCHFQQKKKINNINGVPRVNQWFI